MENLNNSEAVNLEAVDMPRPVCPILSLMPGAGLHHCELDNCAWYNCCNNECIVWTLASYVSDGLNGVSNELCHLPL